MQRTRAIVRQPSPRIADGEVTHITREPMDVKRAFAQHAAYVELLRRHGLTIVEAPTLDDHPDGIFVEDTLVMIDAFAVITRPGAPSRRGETTGMVDLVESLGARSGVIEAPGRVDGGDVLVTDAHVFVGQTSRSNKSGLTQFDRFARPLRRKGVGVEVTGCLHLKSAITSLPDGSLIAVQRWVDIDMFTDLGYTVHKAQDNSGGDVLVLGDTVVLPTDAPETAAMLRTLGFAVETIDVGELQKIEAGVTCMSVLL